MGGCQARGDGPLPTGAAIWHRRRHVKRALLWLAVGLSSCTDATLESHAQLPKLTEALEGYGMAPTVASTEVATLAYEAPTADCAHVLQITVQNEPDLMHEPDSVSYLSLGLDDVPDEPFVQLRTMYRGFRAEKGVQRVGSMSATQAGPASPTAGCLPQTWDPIEDAMTLGWPELTGRLTGIRERWTGHRVAGKCNRAACVDPQTGGGGPENHHRVCVTQDWQNELVGIFEHDGEQLALVRGTWTDGHGPVGPSNTTGIWSERHTLINLEHGRPMWSRLRLHHSFPQPVSDKSWSPVDRTWEMHTADACPGSLAAHGWDRPPEVLDGVDDQLALQADPSLLRQPVRREPAPANEPKPADGGAPYIVPKPDATPPPGAVPPSLGSPQE